MNIFRAIFGTADNTKTLVDGAVSGIDALVFTDEEKSRASAQAADWFLKYLAATQPQNLARRLIALMIVSLWGFLALLGVALFKVDRAYSEFVFKVLAEVVMNPFLMVMGFYFAAHVVRAWQGDKH